MVKNAKNWWWLYGIICTCVLLPVGIVGLIERTLLTPLLEPGGLIESFPAVIYAVASILGLIFAWQMGQSNQKYWGWILYSIMCFFLAGEEAGWGKESVLGWQLQNDPNAEVLDFHNWISDLLIDLRNRQPRYLVLIVLSIAVVFGTFWISKLLRRGKKRMTLLQRLRGNLSQGFLFLGCILILVGSSLDVFQKFFDLPYMVGQWPVEESLELLGSFALLFAILQKLFYHCQSTGKVKQ